MALPDPDVALQEPGERDLGRRPYRRAALVTTVFAGGLVAYTVHLLVVFWGAPAYCGPAGVGTAVVTTALMALAAALCLALGVRGLRRLRVQEGEPGSRAPEDGPARAEAWDPAPSSTPRWWHVAGVFLSGHALLILVLVAIGLVLLPTCV